MKSNQNLLYLLILIFAISSCKIDANQYEQKHSNKIIDSSATHVQDRKLTRIDALYYNYILESKAPVKPEALKKSIPQFDIDKKGILDAVITNSRKLNKIQSMLANLQPSPTQNEVDARMIFVLNFNDGHKDTLCIGGIYSDKIYLNRTEYTRDNELLFLLKDYIGFYPWLIGDDMFKMSELQDNSFPKPPFTSSLYYKQYQEALAKK